MQLHRLAAAAFLATILVAAHADTYQYAFSFTNLSNGEANFDVTIDTSGLIHTTGLTNLSTPLPTSLGYNVDNFGEDIYGYFAFSQSGGSITDGGVVYSSTTFEFTPPFYSSDYDGVGTYAGGYVEGNLLSYPDNFHGNASLVITDLSAVAPEPSSFVLLGTGLFGMAGMIRRRSA